jgi:hypothetical protein
MYMLQNHTDIEVGISRQKECTTILALKLKLMILR